MKPVLLANPLLKELDKTKVNEMTFSFQNIQ